ncbi:MAG: DUF2339 domain-containing protein [Acidobacteriota bacterium]
MSIPTVVAMALGLFIGAIDHGFPGGILGGAIGFAVASAIETRRRISALEEELAWLRRDKPVVATEEIKPPEPAELEEITLEEPWKPPPPREKPAYRPVDFDSKASAPPPYQPQPSPARSWFSAIREVIENWLTGGNLLVKLGVVILFIGVAFLLKYAAERNRLPIELRLIGVALGGIALLATGWVLRRKRENYALALQGGGVGIIYLTVFAALRLYSMVPPLFAFFILAALGGLSASLAVLQDSRSMAVLGISGGFLAPVLTSTGQGSHVMLFSYYTLLNAGILGIAWFKAWRVLNLVGFAFTFGIGAAWGVLHYRPEHFSSTEPFLIVFFFFYTAVATLFATRRPPELKGYVDGTLVFGTPLIAFAQQAALVSTFKYGIALSALGLGLFYVVFAWVLFKRESKNLQTLVEAFLSLGVAFGTVVIPLALDSRWTAGAWALEGCALVWVGVRQQRLLARVSGVLRQLAAGIALFLDPVGPARTPGLDGFVLGSLAVAMAGFFTSYYLHRNRGKVRLAERAFGTVLAAWAFGWWYAFGYNAIEANVPYSYRSMSLLLFASLTCLACGYLHPVLEWPLLQVPALAIVPVLAVSTFLCLFQLSHPTAKGFWAAWPVALASCYTLLYRYDETDSRVLGPFHAATLWIVVFLFAWELDWWLGQWIAPPYYTILHSLDGWGSVAWGIIPGLAVLAVSMAGYRLVWPTENHYRTYIALGCSPLAFFLWLWTIANNVANPGISWPLDYLPILNPLDVTIGFVLLTLAYWIIGLKSEMAERFTGIMRTALLVLFGIAGFVWLNGILARTVHHWGGVGFSADALFGSMLFQAALSILWTLTALCAMVFSSRAGLRPLWLTGAALLLVVVVKLFTVDLSRTGTVERIVSFIVVGLLLLLVGYLSPVPPRKEAL